MQQTDQHRLVGKWRLFGRKFLAKDKRQRERCLLAAPRGHADTKSMIVKLVAHSATSFRGSKISLKILSYLDKIPISLTYESSGGPRARVICQADDLQQGRQGLCLFAVLRHVHWVAEDGYHTMLAYSTYLILVSCSLHQEVSYTLSNTLGKPSYSL